MSKRILKLGEIPIKHQDDVFTKYVCHECGCEFEATSSEITGSFTMT